LDFPIWPDCVATGSCGRCSRLATDDPTCEVYQKCFNSNGCSPLSSCAVAVDGACHASTGSVRCECLAGL
jgi:hypothetical protein